MLPSEEQVMEALKTVVDPEIHIDIVNLGLIYGIEKNEEKSFINVKMTLTSPACPYGPEIIRQSQQAVVALPEVKEANIEIVFSPPWDPRTMASDEGKDILGIF